MHMQVMVTHWQKVLGLCWDRFDNICSGDGAHLDFLKMFVHKYCGIYYPSAEILNSFYRGTEDHGLKCFAHLPVELGHGFMAQDVVQYCYDSPHPSTMPNNLPLGKI